MGYHAGHQNLITVAMHTLEQLRSGALHGLRRLDLAADLTEFPREIFTLADSLEILNLSGNQLSSLPADLPRLRQLKVIFCSNNRFTELPAVLGQCPALEMVGFKSNQIRVVPAAALPARLRWLILTDNQIGELPAALGQCTRLQKLMLAGNHLQHLPASLAQCQQLELLRIAANDFHSLPACLWDFPALAWLAFAGNPFSAELEAAALQRSVPEVVWPALQLGERLGEGTSGQIFAASWQGQATAVKCFKAGLGSDGWTESELAANLAAPPHPNLIRLLARVQDAPAGQAALLFDRIGAEFSVMAGPPSLESCTRDVYPADLRFTRAQAEAIYGGIASAVNAMNAAGLIHGDVYAHNLLWYGEHSYLGDLGAASLFDPADQPLARRLQVIEARALAHLRAELFSRVSAD